MGNTSNYKKKHEYSNYKINKMKEKPSDLKFK